jgi:hypothetical protein
MRQWLPEPRLLHELARALAADGVLPDAHSAEGVLTDAHAELRWSTSSPALAWPRSCPCTTAGPTW